MNISSLNSSLPITATAQQAASQTHGLNQLADPLRQPAAQSKGELREAFDRFVGETFYGQLLGAMRQTVGRPAYFHGGRAEEVFQNQLDQVLSEKLSHASAESFTDPMFELFNLNRRP